MSEHIGLVTVLYNSEFVLKQFFESLALQRYTDFELIIVDNMSSDNSLDLSKKFAAEMPFNCFFIENKENLGVAKGNNQGIELALSHKCTKILLTNNDIVLNNDTIQNLYEGHISENADLSAPKILYEGCNKIWYAGGYFNRLKGTTTHNGYGKDDCGQYDFNKRVQYAPTCFMLINSDVFDKVGMMDEKYFVYYDDTDFVFRCVKYYRLSLMYIYSSSLQHKVSFSTGSDSPFTLRYMFRNRIYFSKKHNNFSLVYYVINVLYHSIIRRIKLRNNVENYKIISDAMKEGWLL